MITIEQYFGKKEAPVEHIANAVELLRHVNALLEEAEADGLRLHNDPDTGTKISGSKGGAGDGGYRLPDSTTGKPSSSHRSGEGIDIYDPGDRLDKWITRDVLIRHNLYREASPFTQGWSHLTTRRPKSGNRSFIP